MKRHPLSEPILWLVVGLPAISVIAGIGLVVTAVNSGRSDTVNDKVQRTAQIQVTDLHPDERARSMRLSALLRINGHSLEILPVSGNFNRNHALILTLEHPSDASKDRIIKLTPSTQGWHAAFDSYRNHDWLLYVKPDNSDKNNNNKNNNDDEWRLRGRLHAKQYAAYLGPALLSD